MGTAEGMIIFGEVLFDRFQSGNSVLGGAPFNVAWNLRAFGADPLFVSRVGDDEEGRRVISSMREWGMDTAFVQVDKSRPTGRVNVSIRDSEPCFDILNGQAYDYISYDEIDLGGLPGLGIIYHGTLAMRNPVSRTTLMEIIEVTSATPFVDVNLRPPWWSRDVLDSALGSGRWAKLNRAELDTACPGCEGDIEEKASLILRQFRLDHVIVTLGGDGAVAVTEAGSTFSVLPESESRVVDTVGAGDAFSSVILLGLMRGWPLETSMKRAQGFASAVVGIEGATNLDIGFYESVSEGWG